MNAEQRSDKLADLIWWIQGWNAAHGDSHSDLNESHIEALRLSRIDLNKRVLGESAAVSRDGAA